MIKRKKSASPLLSEKNTNELEGLLDEEINVTLFKKLTDRIYLKNLLNIMNLNFY